MAYPPRFMDELKSRTSLMAVVARRVKLTKRGNEYIGCCPFHNEKTPSFHVVEDKGFYHCFGCGVNGDAISFCMESEGLSFNEAIEHLAQNAGMEVPKSSPADIQAQQQQLGLYDITEQACQFFQTALYSPQGKQALNYLHGRGLSDSTIKHFRLGYAPAGNELQTHLTAHDISKQDMDDLGLVRFNDRGGYAFFRDRVMFPICDERGRPIAFGGRFMGDEKLAKTGKYVNSPDTPLFDKGRTLYNLHNAKTIARKSNEIIVAEGYMDVIAMTQAGIANAVAPLGTATTEHQLHKLWRLVDEPTLCFDGDNAGRRAGERAGERALPILTPGKSLNLCYMPQGLDPDDFIKQQGANALSDHLKNTIPLVQSIWESEYHQKPLNTPETKAEFEKRLINRANEIADKTVADYYRGTFKDWIWQKIKRPQNKTTRGKTGKGVKWNADPINSMERELKSLPQTMARRRQQTVLAVGINHPELTNLYWDSYDTLPLDNDLSQIRNALLSELLDTPNATADHLAQILTPLYPKPMAEILSPSLYTLSPQAKPTAEITNAQSLLDDILSLNDDEAQTAELQKIKNDPTKSDEQKWQTLTSLNPNGENTGQ